MNIRVLGRSKLTWKKSQRNRVNQHGSVALGITSFDVCRRRIYIRISEQYVHGCRAA